MPCPQSSTIFWHRDLPPLDAEPAGDYVVEATSNRVSGSLAHRDELWDRCYEELMTHACARIEQELARLDGDYAHVLEESVHSRRDDARGEAWLHGVFTYVLYKTPPQRRAG